MMNFLNVSIWVILISAVVNMGGGMLWYGPLFGKAWMKGMGFKEEDKEAMQKSAGPAYGFSLLFALVFGYVIDLVMNFINPSGIVTALIITVLLYLGFGCANTVKGRLWGEVNKDVFRINTLFEIVYILLVGVAAYFL